MEKWKEFFDLLMGGDYFILFIIVMMLIIFGLIIYLIKLQVSDKYNNNEVIEEMEEFLKNKEEKKVMSIEENIKPIQTTLELKNEIVDPISEYENIQEKEAVISTSELEKKISNMKENGSLPEVSINNYEEEQERKAIISYEELLNRASVTLNYKDASVEGLKISKVEVDDPLNPINHNYELEEEFLRALKEFRASL